MAGETLMIVGAGAGQLPAIRRARAMGLTVVTIDRDPSAPGMSEADVAIAVDVTDQDAAVRVAREHHVRGVMTMQSDLPVWTVGAVVDALALRGAGLAVADRCSNKIALRTRFAAAGIPQPRFEVVGPDEDPRPAASRIGFPCVVKAPDSSGSRGVVRVDSTGEVMTAAGEARAHSREGRILIEAFVDGLELGAQSFSVRGRCVQVWPHDDTVSTPPFMVPTGHSYPSTMDGVAADRVRHAVADAVDALGITDGPANIDLILTEDGEPQIIEIGARIGATCLPELTTLHTGIDWVGAAIESALGLEPDLTPAHLQPVAAFILEAPRDGILAAWTVDEAVLQDPRLVEWEVSVQPGDTVSRLRKGTDRIGKVVAAGPDPTAALERAAAFRAAFDFDVHPTSPAAGEEQR